MTTDPGGLGPPAAGSVTERCVVCDSPATRGFPGEKNMWCGRHGPFYASDKPPAGPPSPHKDPLSSPTLTDPEALTGKEGLEALRKARDAYVASDGDDNRMMDLLQALDEALEQPRAAPVKDPADSAAPTERAAAPQARTHDLKCHPPFFGLIVSGAKTFEARWNDRQFHVGDLLRLREWIPTPEDKGGVRDVPVAMPGVYTGREALRTVTYILESDAFGIAPGWAILALAPPTAGPSSVPALPSGARQQETLLPDQPIKDSGPILSSGAADAASPDLHLLLARLVNANYDHGDVRGAETAIIAHVRAAESAAYARGRKELEGALREARDHCVGRALCGQFCETLRLIDRALKGNTEHIQEG